MATHNLDSWGVPSNIKWELAPLLFKVAHSKNKQLPSYSNFREGGALTQTQPVLHPHELRTFLEFLRHTGHDHVITL